MRADRVQAFSDGIFAILITILVLEFKLPVYHAGHLSAEVFKQWPIMAAYSMTYLYIGILWLFHHDMFQHIKKTTPALNVLNLFSLFLTTLISYSMSLLAESLTTLNQADLRFSASIYTLVALAVSFSYLILYYYLNKNNALLNEDTPSAYFGKGQNYPLYSVLVYLLAFICLQFNNLLGIILLVLGIINHGLFYWHHLKSDSHKI